LAEKSVLKNSLLFAWAYEVIQVYRQWLNSITAICDDLGLQ